MSHVYCLECGFQNPEAANYCSKCGALLPTEEAGAETTITFRPDDDVDEGALLLEELGIHGPALVVRAGGGRAGEHFTPTGERTTSAGPWTPRSSSAASISSPSAGLNACVCSPLSGLWRGAPHFEQ